MCRPRWLRRASGKWARFDCGLRISDCGLNLTASRVVFRRRQSAIRNRQSAIEVSAIDEGIVREYFEQNGFLVRQARKYQVSARRKAAEEEIDLIVFNPTWQRGARKPDFFLFSNELPYVQKAIVAVKGWHSGVFTPTMLKSSPEIFRFLEENVLKEASRLFPPDVGDDESSGAPTKILVLPSLPIAEPFRS